MSPFFRPEPELGLVLHIGSSSIAAGLIRLNKGELPQIIYMLRELIRYQENLNPEQFFSDMLDTLKVVNSRLAKEGLTHLKFTEFGSLKIKHVYYVFSSPWAVTQTKISTISKPEGFVLTEDMVNAVIEAQEKAFESETLGDTNLSDALRAVEKRVVQIKLNGYEILSPYGKKAKRADISVFVSIVPKAVLDKVFDISVTTYHPKDTTISSLSLASYSIIRDVFHDQNDFMLLDVGGEVSDLTIVKDGVLVETASFPLGRNFIVRRIAKLMGVTAEEAASLVKLFHEGHIDPAVEAKLKPDITQASEEWMVGFRNVLTRLSEKMSLPTTVYTIIYNDFVHFFMKVLRNEKISEFGVNDFSLSAILVNHESLKSVVSFGKHADKDPFVAILAAFAGRLYEEKIK